METKSKATPAAKKAADPLIGRGMHWLDEEGCVRWQGLVIAALPDGYYLVQLFSWIAGEPVEQVVMHLSSMSATKASTNGKPIFYDNAEDMNWHYEHRFAHKKKRAEVQGKES